jgi:hypothetical protein
MRIGLEQHGELAGLPAMKRRTLSPASAPDGVRGAVDRPRRTRLHQQPFAMGVGAGIGRHVDAGELVADFRWYSSLWKKSLATETKSRSKPGVRSCDALTARSVGLPAYTVAAAVSGVPRFHSLTMRG